MVVLIFVRFLGEQNGSHPYQHQTVNDQQPTLLKLSQAPQQLVGIPFPQAGVPMQVYLEFKY